MSKDTEFPYKKLAKIVKEAREARQLSQRQLSAMIEMSGSYITHLENGKIQPTVKTLKKISHTLRLPYAVLAVLSGYIETEHYNVPEINQEYLDRLADISDLSDEEWKSVLDYAQFIRDKRPKST